MLIHHLIVGKSHLIQNWNCFFRIIQQHFHTLTAADHQFFSCQFLEQISIVNDAIMRCDL